MLGAQSAQPIGASGQATASNSLNEWMEGYLANYFIGFGEALPRKPFPQFYVSDVYRFLYAAHLSEQRAGMPPWIGEPVLVAR